MDKELIKQNIITGFKTCLLWVNEEQLEENNNNVYTDEFSNDALIFIEKIVDRFIKDSDLFSIYNEFKGDSLEHTLGEQIGHDLYLTITGAGINFLDREERLYNGNGEFLNEVAEKEIYCINDIWVNSDNLIEVE